MKAQMGSIGKLAWALADGICWLRWGKRRLCCRWGFAYFSERYGYKVPFWKVGKFRFFWENDR